MHNKETQRWSNPQKEIAINYFFSHQNNGDAKSIYVPTHAGVLLHNDSIHVASSIGSNEVDPHISIFSLVDKQKTGLETDGLYDCAALTISNQKDIKLLIHAQGSNSLLTLFHSLQEHIPYKIKEEQYTLLLAYNPKYFLNIHKYEYALFHIKRRIGKNVTQRTRINVKSVITV